MLAKPQQAGAWAKTWCFRGLVTSLLILTGMASAPMSWSIRADYVTGSMMESSRWICFSKEFDGE
jgi:hypothetical protein